MKFKLPSVKLHSITHGVQHGTRHFFSILKDIRGAISRFSASKSTQCNFEHLPKKKGIKPSKVPLLLLLSHIQAALFNGFLIGFVARYLWLIYADYKSWVFVLFLILFGLGLWLARGFGSAIAAWINVPLDEHELALYHAPSSYFKNTIFEGDVELQGDKVIHKKGIKHSQYLGIETLNGKRGEIPLESQLAFATTLSRVAALLLSVFLKKGLQYIPFVLLLLPVVVSANTYAANIRGVLSKKKKFLLSLKGTNLFQIKLVGGTFAFGLLMLFSIGMLMSLGMLKLKGNYKLGFILISALGLIVDWLFAHTEVDTIHNAPDYRFYWLPKYYTLKSKVKIAYAHLAYGLFPIGVLVFYIFTVRGIPVQLSAADKVDLLPFLYFHTYLIFNLFFMFSGYLWRKTNSVLGGGKIAAFAFRGFYYATLILFARQVFFYYHRFRVCSTCDLIMIALWIALIGVFSAVLAHAVKAFYRPMLFSRPMEKDIKLAERWFDVSTEVFPTYPEPASQIMGVEFREWGYLILTMIILYVLSQLLSSSGFAKFFPYPGFYFVALIILFRDHLLSIPSDRKWEYQNASDLTRTVDSLALLTRGNLYEDHSLVTILWLEGATGFMWGYDYIYNFMSWRLF